MSARLFTTTIATCLAFSATPAFAQCYVESIDTPAAHGSMIAASSDFLHVVNDTATEINTYLVTSVGHSLVGTKTLDPGLTVVSIDADSFELVYAVDHGFFYETRVRHSLFSVEDSVFFSGAEPEVGIGRNSGGTWLAVGFADGGFAGGGDTHLYQRASGATFFAKIDTIVEPGGEVLGNRFGQGVAMQGDALAISAPRNDLFATDAGAIYGYRWDGTTWNQNTAWFAGTPGGEAYSELAISDDTIIAGSPLVASGAGVVEFFPWNGTIYDFDSGWLAPGGTGSAFGSSVDIEGDYAIGGTDGGSAVTFSFNGTGWQLDTVVTTPPSGIATSSVAVDTEPVLPGTRFYVGDPTYDGTGAVHTFTSALSTATNLGNSLPGFGGAAPTLGLGSELCAYGGELDIAIGSLRPNSIVSIFVGLNEGAANFKGGTFVPSSLIFQLIGIPTGTGSLSFDDTLGYDLQGFSLVMQAWALDEDAIKGVSASNGLRIDFGG